MHVRFNIIRLRSLVKVLSLTMLSFDSCSTSVRKRIFSLMSMLNGSSNAIVTVTYIYIPLHGCNKDVLIRCALVIGI